eukprot:g3344.t1
MTRLVCPNCKSVDKFEEGEGGEPVCTVCGVELVVGNVDRSEESFNTPGASQQRRNFFRTSKVDQDAFAPSSQQQESPVGGARGTSRSSSSKHAKKNSNLPRVGGLSRQSAVGDALVRDCLEGYQWCLNVMTNALARQHVISEETRTEVQRIWFNYLKQMQARKISLDQAFMVPSQRRQRYSEKNMAAVLVNPTPGATSASGAISGKGDVDNSSERRGRTVDGQQKAEKEKAYNAIPAEEEQLAKHLESGSDSASEHSSDGDFASSSASNGPDDSGTTSSSSPSPEDSSSSEDDEVDWSTRQKQLSEDASKRKKRNGREQPSSNSSAKLNIPRETRTKAYHFGSLPPLNLDICVSIIYLACRTWNQPIIEKVALNAIKIQTKYSLPSGKAENYLTSLARRMVEMGSKVKRANFNAAKREKERMAAQSLSQGQSDSHNDGSRALGFEKRQTDSSNSMRSETRMSRKSVRDRQKKIRKEQNALSPDHEVRQILQKVAARHVCSAVWEISRFTEDVCVPYAVFEPNVGNKSMRIEMFELFDLLATPHTSDQKRSLVDDMGGRGNRTASRYIRCAFGLVSDMPATFNKVSVGPHEIAYANRLIQAFCEGDLPSRYLEHCGDEVLLPPSSKRLKRNVSRKSTTLTKWLARWLFRTPAQISEHHGDPDARTGLLKYVHGKSLFEKSSSDSNHHAAQANVGKTQSNTLEELLSLEVPFLSERMHLWNKKLKTNATNDTYEKCGDCDNCKRSSPCGKCENCRQMTRFGGCGIGDPRCIMQICHQKRIVQKQVDLSLMTRNALQLWVMKHEDEVHITPAATDAHMISTIWDYELSHRDYRGLHRCRGVNKFRADIDTPQGNLFIGIFPTITAAANAYNTIARQIYGDGCFQNIIQNPIEMTYY